MILIDLILNVVTLSFLLGIPVGIAKYIAYFVVDIKCHDQNTVSPELIAELERKLEKRRKELEGEKLK